LQQIFNSYLTVPGKAWVCWITCSHSSYY
jgi:hypothetical protein